MKGRFITLLQTFKVMLLFIGCTLFFYYGILWVSQEYESYYRYDVPEGNAVKVVAEPIGDHEDSTILTRLAWFYKLGE
ncbi:YqzK family protein [Alkalicoccobacillus murimartini]|uniref:DUF4227 family protein n=1 Tax=Alkalicoccobacillus murimartini TaxID=171685 RepID=A0ABT9YD70_9BACI|nr:YqzK family protein [Alkalicoccobacillus murimartini]MDQ0205772.1 hypothetical protein [Alkalicoccobacillus murimartini]